MERGGGGFRRNWGALPHPPRLLTVPSHSPPTTRVCPRLDRLSFFSPLVGTPRSFLPLPQTVGAFDIFETIQSLLNIFVVLVAVGSFVDSVAPFISPTFAVSTVVNYSRVCVCGPSPLGM